MIRFLFAIFLVLSISSKAQEKHSATSLNDIFKLTVDSIEQRVTIEKWAANTKYYLHYQVKNISNTTLTYITNTCFYYNHSSLQVEELKFELNPSGGCLYNSYNLYKLTPGMHFTESQWITAQNLNTLKNGVWNSTLFVPLVKDNQVTYRVDGRKFIENVQYLIFEGKIKITKTVIDNRKRKRKKKHLTLPKTSG